MTTRRQALLAVLAGLPAIAIQPGRVWRERYQEYHELAEIVAAIDRSKRRALGRPRKATIERSYP
jgi:hypothetical protein